LYTDNQGRNEVKWCPGQEASLAPHVRTWVFQEQIYCIEEITCDIVGTFRHRSDSAHPVAYEENFRGGFIQWHMVIICTWCALYVTSQFDVMFMFPNQRFGEQHNMHILTHAISLFYVLLHSININYQRSKLGHQRKIHSTLRHSNSTAKISDWAL